MHPPSFVQKFRDQIFFYVKIYIYFLEFSLWNRNSMVQSTFLIHNRSLCKRNCTADFFCSLTNFNVRQHWKYWHFPLLLQCLHLTSWLLVHKREFFDSKEVLKNLMISTILEFLLARSPLSARVLTIVRTLRKGTGRFRIRRM